MCWIAVVRISSNRFGLISFSSSCACAASTSAEQTNTQTKQESKRSNDDGRDKIGLRFSNHRKIPFISQEQMDNEFTTHKSINQSTNWGMNAEGKKIKKKLWNTKNLQAGTDAASSPRGG
jgi:hypothetical protein